METNWISVIKNGNPKEDGDYFVTYIDGTGNPKVTVKRWQANTWWFDGKHTIVVAYANMPKPSFYQLPGVDKHHYSRMRIVPCRHPEPEPCP